MFNKFENMVKPLYDISDYLIYAYTFISFISYFAELGGFIKAILYYLIFVLIMLGVAAKKHIALVALFLGNGVLSGLNIVCTVTDYHLTSQSSLMLSSIWQQLLGIVINGLLVWYFIREIRCTTESNDEKVCPNCMHECFREDLFCARCGFKWPGK